MNRRLLTLLIALLSLTPATAEEDACLAPPEPGRIDAALPGNPSVRLADGRTLRLADLRSPGPNADGPTTDFAVPIADDTRPSEPGRAPTDGLAATLAALEGAEVLVRPLPGAPIDRHGRTLGTAVLKDTGADLSHALLADGLALVEPAVMSEECLAVLLAAERQAEAAKKGIWAREAVLSALSRDLAAKAGQRVLVAGTVQSVGRSRRSIYLNFGADWRSDFTVMLSPSTAKELAEDPAALAGARVRIRGVLEAWNGGLIKVEHPAQIERLDGSVRSR